MVDDLRAHRWQVVARVWNGPGYAENRYDQRLQSRYNWWAKIPDTPWEGEIKGQAVVVHSTVRRGDKGDDVRTLQKLLSLTPDGVFGPVTEGAVKKFQAKHDLAVDGVVGKHTWELLVGQSSL
jgi:murein L,D-transpeptidase YcbB/YkuD